MKIEAMLWSVVLVLVAAAFLFPRTRALSLSAIGVAIFIGALFILQEKILYYVLPAFFTLYLVYGFVRPSLSRAWRREIEEEDEEHEAN